MGWSDGNNNHNDTYQNRRFKAQHDSTLNWLARYDFLANVVSELVDFDAQSLGGIAKQRPLHIFGMGPHIDYL